MAPLRIKIIGERLPGRAAGGRTNVHIGIQKGDEIVDFQPADAPSAVFEIVVARRDDGDFGGPYVHGRKGDRFLYLSWAEIDADSGEPSMFSRVKVMLSAIPTGLLRPGTTSLEAYLPLSDGEGRVVTASVRPPAINWESS